jgi:hypothetical protein
MPKFQDTAVVAGRQSGGSAEMVRKALEGAVDGDLKVTAWLAHQAMITDAQQSDAEEILGVENGAVWLRWHGSLAGVMRDLDLITKDYRKQTVEDNTLRRSVSKLLSRTGNAICIFRTNARAGGIPPVWAVRAEFRERDVIRGEIDWEALGRLPGEPAQFKRAAEQPSAPVAALKPAPPPEAGDATEALPLLPAKRISCRDCGELVSVEMVLRHMRDHHGFDPVPPVLDAIRQRRTQVRSPELAELLVEACGGGIVSTAHIGRLLTPFARDPGHPVTAVRAFKDFWYDWVEADAPASPSQPPPKKEPEPEAAASVEELTPVALSPNGSHAPVASTAPDTRLAVLSAAFQRAEDAVQMAYLALDEVKVLAEEIAAENSELRAYRSRVRSLLAPEATVNRA